MSTTTNYSRLTASHRVVQAKKRVQQNQIKQVIFDEDDRREYLSGFHKRKVARLEAARAKAKEKEKAIRQEVRRQRRRSLRERAVENAVQIERACGAISDDGDEEWNGITISPALGEMTREEEYENDEVLATVTVVEDFDPDTLIHGPSNSITNAESYSESLPQETDLSYSKSKPKTKKVYYETKSTRKINRKKQLARKSDKAERAGGKASRKSGPKTRRR